MSPKPQRIVGYDKGSHGGQGVLIVSLIHPNGVREVETIIKIYSEPCRVFDYKCFDLLDKGGDKMIFECMKLSPKAGRCYFLDRRLR